MQSERRLDRTAQDQRLAYRDLAGLSCIDRIRVAVELEYLPRMEGTFCPHKCGTKLALSDRTSFQQFEQMSTKRVLKVGKLKIKRKLHIVCRYVCNSRECEVNKHGLPMQSDSSKGFRLGGRGRAPAGEGVLSIWLASQDWSAHHTSLQDSVLVQGNSHDSMQLYLDETRRRQAELNILEQRTIIFQKGMLTEWDEAGVRAVRVACAKNCKKCLPPCLGYRLRWNRWLIGVQRANRKMLVVKQLPFKESRSDAGGVPLSATECDRFCLPLLGFGVINLSDGASPYEAFASGDIVCSPTCQREACL